MGEEAAALKILFSLRLELWHCFHRLSDASAADHCQLSIVWDQKIPVLEQSTQTYVLYIEPIFRKEIMFVYFFAAVSAGIDAVGAHPVVLVEEHETLDVEDGKRDFYLLLDYLWEAT